MERFSPKPPESAKKSQAAAKYGEKQASKPGLRERGLNWGINVADKYVVPGGLIFAVATAPFAPGLSALFLGGAAGDYIKSDIAKGERDGLAKRRKERDAKLKANQGPVFEAAKQKKKKKKKQVALAA